MSDWINLTNAILFGIGCLASFLSGLLGVGGSGYLLPMILYLPKYLAGTEIEMPLASTLSIAVIWLASLSATFSFSKGLFNDHLKPLMINMSIPCAVLGFIGSLVTKSAQDNKDIEVSFRLTFAVLSLFGGSMMCIKPKVDEWNIEDPFKYSKIGSFISAAIVGFCSGLLGAGGAFILKPIMMYFLGIPTRIAIVVSMPVVFATSTTSFIAKLISGQGDWIMMFWLVLPSFPMAKLGTVIGKKTNAKNLRGLSAGIFIVLALYMLFDGLNYWFKWM
ncbi:hypothetical protein RCL1_004947 [Eukaryota sp. TZLM3-RCL]